jgi:PAS domain S-box-containing protein
MAEMLGYTPQELVGREVFAFLFPEDSAWFEERMAAVRRGESFVCERRYLRRDGNTVTTLASIAPSIDDAGRFQGTFAMMIDITAQKRDQAEREELRHRLEQSQKLESIGRLAGGVAHDFNNLLTVINGYSDMLIRDLPEDDPDRPAIEEIRAAGERAAALTKQLLAFGRRQISRPRPLDLNAVIRDAAQMLQRLIGEDITLETRLEPALDAVEADPGQIHQVLLNLSINARDAMTDGGVLTIATANARFEAGTAPHGCQAGAYVALRVADTGVGMDEETMRHLFEPFFTTKADGFGTGLGLATVYGIVEQSGGSIQVDSEPGKGCRFDIHLPRAEGPVEPATPAAAEAAGQGRELTVLVVEDQQSVRGLAARALRDCGYNVIEAGSGEEALALAEAVEDVCQLVVTDVVMPGMSGKTMADKLRKHWPEVKVLYMSGYPNEVLLRHGLMDGEIDYLEKPFTPAGLAAKVREVMG